LTCQDGHRVLPASSSAHVNCCISCRAIRRGHFVSTHGTRLLALLPWKSRDPSGRCCVVASSFISSSGLVCSDRFHRVDHLVYMWNGLLSFGEFIRFWEAFRSFPDSLNNQGHSSSPLVEFFNARSDTIVGHPACGPRAGPRPDFLARHEIKRVRAGLARVSCRVWTAPSACGPVRPGMINCRLDRGTRAGSSMKGLLRPMSSINFVCMYI